MTDWLVLLISYYCARKMENDWFASHCICRSRFVSLRGSVFSLASLGEPEVKKATGKKGRRHGSSPTKPNPSSPECRQSFLLKTWAWEMPQSAVSKNCLKKKHVENFKRYELKIKAERAPPWRTAPVLVDIKSSVEQPKQSAKEIDPPIHPSVRQSIN